MSRFFPFLAAVALLATLGLAIALPNPEKTIETVNVAPLPTIETPKPRTATLLAVGDIMLSRDVGRKIAKNGVDEPFEKTRDVLRAADLTFGNLETPIEAGPDVPVDSLIFHAAPGVEVGVKNAGFDVLSLANNHTPNAGGTGLRNTIRLVQAAGMSTVGAGTETHAYEPAYRSVNGLKFAFLAENDTDVVPDSYCATGDRLGTACMDVKKMATAVRIARKRADIVIISMHSGTEYTPKLNRSQQTFAHTAIDAGADLVIGHHPHVVQSAEKYNGKYIFYSLGNFVFDQMWSQETRDGLAIRVTFTKRDVTAIDLLPVIIDDYSQPRWVDGEDATRITARLGSIELPTTH